MEAVETTALEQVHPVHEQELENLPSTMLFSRDPEEAFREAERLVGVVARRCTGPGYLVDIRGKQYPKIEWWTTVAASLGLFPRTVFARRLNRDGEIAYEARVEVHHNGTVISAGEALCSNREARWQSADEYAIKSMAITRASGKAYRIPLSFLAVMAGLEATPAEEMPVEPQVSQPSQPVRAGSDTSSNGEPATSKQIKKLQELAVDERLTSQERTKLKTLLLEGVSKSKASQVMEHFFGKSVYQGGEWVRVSDGILNTR